MKPVEACLASVEISRRKVTGMQKMAVWGLLLEPKYSFIFQMSIFADNKYNGHIRF
ncbi:hypothetical protein BBR01nite_19330 [Brevibacillus brevis]|nr:hypothetical protein BBR01nite_19330 [Brevibacillus brevis]